MADQFIGQTLADKYKIESVMRNGGLGKTYHATHLLMDKPVSVKILPPALAVDESIVKNFSSEARTVSHISHPNILNVTDFGSDKNGAVYIVMEDAGGETLEKAIETEGKFSVERAARISRQIAAALSVAHANGIVHGHLNAENVLLTRAPGEIETVKILDFASFRPEQDNVFDEETNLDEIKYLSPEQNSYLSEPDARSDIYSLGVILYEMLAGEAPFTAETPGELVIKQAETPPVPLSAFRNDLPAAVEPVVLKSLAKNPEMRYQSVAEFVDDLNQAVGNAGETETIVAPVAADNTQNNLWKTAFVVLIGIVALSAAMIYLTSSKQTNPTTQLQTDANGLPVQPLNPATGLNEQGAASLMPNSMDVMSANSNMTVPPQPATLPGGDGYDPWANGGRPPAGAPPMYVPPGGQVITIPDGGGSQFMPADGGYILVPVNTNTNANVKPTPTPKSGKTPTEAANANTAPPTTATPQATPETKPTPAPKTEKTPVKPAEQPKKTPSSSSERQVKSGKEQDTEDK